MSSGWRRLVALTAIAASPTVGPESPRDVVRAARQAVEADSVTPFRARLEARLRAAPGDRAAALGLATIARLTYDYPDADRRYAAIYDARAADAAGTYALLGAAAAAYASGFTPRSDTLFDRARASAKGDSAATAEALAGLAMDRAPTRGPPVGLALLDSARRLVPAGDDALAADVAVRRTILMAVMSDAGAAAEGRRARMLARRGGDRRAEGLALRALALDLHLRAQDDSAITDLVEAERLERATHDRSTLSETLLRHADIYHGRGDVGRFQAVMRESAAEATASHNMYALASADVALGVVGLAVGDYEAARVRLDDAARQFAAQGDTSAIVARTFQADLALATGDLATARRLAVRVRDFHHRVHDASEEFEVLRTLAAIERRDGRYDAALAWLDSADALSRRRDRTWARNLERDRGTIALARGDLPRAEALLSAYVAALDTTDHVPRHAARELIAAAAARAGDYPRAERELEAAEGELEAWRATQSDAALRTLAFQVRSSDVDVDGGAAPLVIAALATHGRAAAAFELAERRRARALDDRLRQARALAAADSGASPVRAPASTATAAAARLVDDRTALLEYVTGGGAPTTLFVVTRAAGTAVGAAAGVDVRAVALPAADSLAPAVARLTGLLDAGAAAGPLSASLGSVLSPALALLAPRVDHLVVVADGPLHRLPFDALRTADGRYVAERYVVSVAPSAAVAAELRGRVEAAPPRAARLLAFGDPAFGGASSAGVARGESDGDAAYRSAFDSAGGLPALAASGDEARAVARFAPASVVRLGADASAAFLKHAPLTAFDVIHFATHAVVDERSVARTALALAPGGGESGFVSPGDLAALHLDAGLVVLSACRSAGGVIIDGEGVQGLTAPLLEAGARSVVATEWRIGDRATVAFVTDFYRHLAARLPVAEALRAAKLDAIARGAPPSEWAAFTVVGDPTVRVAVEAPSDRPRRLLLSLGALAAASLGGLLFALARRRRARPA